MAVVCGLLCLTVRADGVAAFVRGFREGEP